MLNDIKVENYQKQKYIHSLKYVKSDFILF